MQSISVKCQSRFPDEFLVQQWGCKKSTIQQLHMHFELVQQTHNTRKHHFCSVKNVVGQHPVWSHKPEQPCSHLCFLVCRFFLFIPASPSVLHLSFPLCPSSPLLFITLLIKADHPERTDFRGGWVRGWEGHKERDMKGRTETQWDRLLHGATRGDQLD